MNEDRNDKDLGELTAEQLERLDEMKSSFTELGVRLSKLLVLNARYEVEAKTIENLIQEVGSELEHLGEKVEQIKENDELFEEKVRKKIEETRQIEEKLESSELDEEGQALLKKARKTRERLEKNADTAGIELSNQLLGGTIKAAQEAHSLFVTDFIEHEQDDMDLNHVLYLAALLHQCLAAGDIDVKEEFEAISKF